MTDIKLQRPAAAGRNAVIHTGAARPDGLPAVGSCGEAFVAKIAAMMSPVTSVAPNVPRAAYRPAMPALLTRTSRPPSASITFATTADGGVVGDVEHEHPRFD